MEVRVEIHGLDQILRRIKALPPELGATRGGPLRKALRAGAKVIKDEAIANAPESDEGSGGFPPGRLKRSIRVRTERHPEKLGATEAMIVDLRRGSRRNQKTDATRYGSYVELGTAKTDPQPFLRPAFDTKKHEALRVIVKAMEKAVTAAEKKLSKMP